MVGHKQISVDHKNQDYLKKRFQSYKGLKDTQM